jgi:hypothetical protein
VPPAYHAERIIVNSEHSPPLADAPVVGEECQVFGGSRRVPIVDIEMTIYFYIFRVGSVVVKLYVAQGVESATPLTATRVHVIAQRIVAKLAALSEPESS